MRLLHWLYCYAERKYSNSIINPNAYRYSQSMTVTCSKVYSAIVDARAFSNGAHVQMSSLPISTEQDYAELLIHPVPIPSTRLILQPPHTTPSTSPRLLQATRALSSRHQRRPGLS